MEETKEEVKEKQDFHEKVIKSAEEAIESLVEDGIQPSDLEMLDKLVDIHKDICEEKYWKRKEKNNMYYGNYNGNYSNGYGNYNGRGAGYDAYGRDSYGEYGRRGYDRKYRGDEHLDRMHGEYNRYSENRERYGANEESKKSLKYMLESMEDFARMLREDAQSQEEVEMIRQAAQRIAQM